MDQQKKIIWQTPWEYREGFSVALGIALTALLLQLLLGNVDPSQFRFPVNVIFGAVFLAGVALAFFIFRRKAFIRWLSSVYSTVPAIAVLLGVIIVMGLTPQLPDGTMEVAFPENVFTKMGWYRMTTSWVFLFLCFYLLMLIEFALLKRITTKQSWRNIGFYLNHTGLLLALLGGILGSADIQRLTMTVKEGNVEWRALDRTGGLRELPVAIELDTFTIEEYPPKLVVIDTHSGKMLPEKQPENYVYGGVGEKTALNGNHIEILEYLPQAGMVQDSNFVNFVPYFTEGATTALKIRVTNPNLKAPVEGWVSNGSFIFPYQVLYIDSVSGIAMPVNEVKKYTSKVTVFTEDGRAEKADIEVNKPLSIENWVIYQLSYDETKGKYSDISVFELVRDPWLKIVYAGIILLMAGALFLFIAGPKKRVYV